MKTLTELFQGTNANDNKLAGGFKIEPVETLIIPEDFDYEE